MNPLHDVIRRLERADALDRFATPLAAAVGRLVRPRRVRNLLSGTGLGHPVHPLLTDVPIGAWSMSALLDTVDGHTSERAADLLVAAGVLAAVPTAASGLNDWSDTRGPDARVGLVHAALNTTALSLYMASLTARARGRRASGKILGLAGLGVLLTGSYLGGHLTFVKGVNVNRTAWQEGPKEWTAVLDEVALPEGERRTLDVGGVPVLLCRSAGRVRALANTCSHMGGPLNEGTISDDSVTCPWHGSVFSLVDGGIRRGPASTPQPHYDVRCSDGRIEIRAVP